MSAVDDLYLGVLREHYDAPHNFGRLDDASAVGHVANPLCGDEVTVYLRLQGDRFAAVLFEGQLCAVSRASASLMTDAVNGQTLDEAMRLSASVEAMLKAQDDRSLGALDALRVVSRHRVRVRCGLLPWEALRAACESWRMSGTDAECTVQE